MKKLLCTLLALLMAMTACTALAQETACAHELAENICTLCGAEVLVTEEGSTVETYYDGQGNVIREVITELDGEETHETINFYAYDEAGNMTKARSYWDGQLEKETDYALLNTGEFGEVRLTCYFEEGFVHVTEFDGWGNPVKDVDCDADGTELLVATFTYEYDEAGRVLRESCLHNGVLIEEKENIVTPEGEVLQNRLTMYYDDGSRSVYEFDEYGTETSQTQYDENGQVYATQRSEQAYNEDGVMLWQKTWVDGRLTYETEYAIAEDEWGGYTCYCKKATTYHEDGSKNVTGDNEHGDTVTWIWYEADGQVSENKNWEYAYSEDGEYLWSKEYSDGRLSVEQVYAMGSAGWNYVATRTLYYEDGSKEVEEANENGEVTAVTAYDAEGSVLSRVEMEYLYDEEGNTTCIRKYRNGMLKEEEIYALEEEGFLYPAVTTVYESDGSKTVIEFDTWGEELSRTIYDEEGNPVSLD